MATTVSLQPTFTFSTPVDVPSGGADDHSQFGHRNIDLTPDGKRFLAVIPRGASQARSPTEIAVVENWLEELKQRVPVK
jgi:hypothetical protein